MGIKLSQVQTKHTASITIIEGEPALEISFRSIPFRRLAEIQEIGKGMQSGSEEAMAQAAKFLITVELGWNIENEDGSPLEVTEDAILDLDAPIVSEIMGKVSEVMSPAPKPTKSEASEGGSSTPM